MVDDGLSFKLIADFLKTTDVGFVARSSLIPIRVDFKVPLSHGKNSLQDMLNTPLRLERTKNGKIADAGFIGCTGIVQPVQGGLVLVLGMLLRFIQPNKDIVGIPSDLQQSNQTLTLSRVIVRVGMYRHKSI